MSDPIRTPDTERILCASTNLKMAARATGRLYDRALAALDLNTAQFSILSNIGRRGSVASMELAGHLSMDRTTLYRALAVLERRGLVATEPGQGREHILTLTPEGKALRQEARVRWQQVQDRFTAAFGEDWETFLAVLDRARAIAEEQVQ